MFLLKLFLFFLDFPFEIFSQIYLYFKTYIINNIYVLNGCNKSKGLGGNC